MSGFKVLRSLKSSTDLPVKTAIRGQIPSWLNGTLYRNGPGRYEFNGKTYSHIFDGQACVHRFKIENGQVFYSNRLLETQSYLKTIQNDRLYPNFGTTDVKSNIFDRINNFVNPPDYSDNVNVNVVPYANNQLYALTESNQYCRLDPKTLKIVNTAKVSKYLSSLRTIIAHPHIERDGTWINMGLNAKGQYQFVRYKGGNNAENSENAGENVEPIAALDSTHKMGFSYFHSFGVTENYIVFLEQALKLSYKHAISSILFNKPISHALVMERDFPTRIHLINKKTGQVIKQKFTADPQFTFHFINCYEDPNEKQVFIDLSSYDANYFDVNGFTYDNMNQGKLKESNMLKAIAKRITVPLNNQQNQGSEIYCETKVLNSEVPFEAPTINYWKNNGLPYRFVYGANHYRDPVSIIKMDVENPSKVIQMKYGQAANGSVFLPSEPIFVEKPNSTSEDDGLLLVMVLADKQNDFLSILDAKTLEEIARAEMPNDVKGAMTFHGFFADNISFKQLNEN